MEEAILQKKLNFAQKSISEHIDFLDEFIERLSYLNGKEKTENKTFLEFLQDDLNNVYNNLKCDLAHLRGEV